MSLLIVEPVSFPAQRAKSRSAIEQEGGLQSVIDATGQCDVWMEIELLEEHYEKWSAHWTSLLDALRATPIPEESRVLMM